MLAVQRQSHVRFVDRARPCHAWCIFQINKELLIRIAELELEAGTGLINQFRFQLDVGRHRREHIVRRHRLLHLRRRHFLGGHLFRHRRFCRNLREQLDGGILQHHLVTLFHPGFEDDAVVGFLPHAGFQGFTRKDRLGKAHFDALEITAIVIAERLDDMASGITEGTQPMQDRLVITECPGKRRVGVQRIPVTAQAIQQRLVGVGFLFDHRIRFT